MLKDSILGALDDAGGRAYLVKQARENPTAFLTLLGKLLPSDVNVAAPDGAVIGYAVTPDKAKSMEEWAQSVGKPTLN